jgi:hypothetical protein
LAGRDASATTRTARSAGSAYEINFNRYFYKYQPPRKLADIDAELKQVEAEIAALLGEVRALNGFRPIPGLLIKKCSKANI